MARDQHIHSFTVDQAIQSELNRLQERVNLLKQRTTTTWRVDTPSNIDDPIEGEVIIDHSDNQIKWYVNGAWRECECLCEEVNTGTIVFVGYQDGSVFQQDIYTIDIEVGTPVKITSVPHGVINQEYFRVMWANDAHTEIIGFYYDYDASPDEGKIQRMNADGSGVVDLYSWSDPFHTVDTRIYRDAAGTIWMTTIDNTETLAQLVNCTTGSVAADFAPTDIIGAGTSIEWIQYNPATDRMIAFVDTASDPIRAYICDPDGGNVVGPVLTFGVDTNAIGAFWSPDGTKIGFYHPSDNTLFRIMDADGTNKTTIYDGTNTLSSVRRFSPDSTKIAFHDYTNFIVTDLSGTVLHTLPMNYPGNDFDWSPDGTRLVNFNANFPSNIEIIDIEAETATIIHSGSVVAYPNQPNWGTTRAFA